MLELSESHLGLLGIFWLKVLVHILKNYFQKKTCNPTKPGSLFFTAQWISQSIYRLLLTRFRRFTSTTVRLAICLCILELTR